MAARKRRHDAYGLAVTLLAANGCMIGPDYARPPAPTAGRWIEAEHATLRAESAATPRWWEVFGDPVLGRLVAIAHAENLTLRAAGLRVLQAQARRGVAIGGLFPQAQQLSGSYTRTRLSLNNQPVLDRDLDSFQAGFDAAWEIDLWGRFRRAIEAADAELLAAVADYDDVLVSLVAEVATTYVQIRVLEERIALARENVRVQRDSLDIATVRFEAGGTSELDVQQARTLLADTKASIPQLEIQRRQAEDSLCVLLGVPPGDLGISSAPRAASPPRPSPSPSVSRRTCSGGGRTWNAPSARWPRRAPGSGSPRPISCRVFSSSAP